MTEETQGGRKAPITHRGPGRPPLNLTRHPIQIACSDEQWAAYNADREARGMTWGEYVAYLKDRADRYSFLEHEDWELSQ